MIMADSPKPKKIAELLEKAHESLRQDIAFEAERLALKALSMARQGQDFREMCRIIRTLHDARRHRMRAGITAARNKITVIDCPIVEEMTIRPGCYLVQPPHLGSDARRLRLM